MQPTIINNIASLEIVPGFLGKYFHAQNLTVGFIDAKAGYTVPIHTHPHEQVSYVQQGKLLFIIEDEEFLLEASMAITIAPNQNTALLQFPIAN